jgi:hypothetical protein
LVFLWLSGQDKDKFVFCFEMNSKFTWLPLQSRVFKLWSMDLFIFWFWFFFFCSYGVKTRVIWYLKKHLKKKGCWRILFTFQRVKPLRTLQATRAKDLDGGNCPYMTVLKRSWHPLSNEVARIVVQWIVWFQWWFLSFFSFSLSLPWKMCYPIKKIHIILLFYLDIWFSHLIFIVWFLP